MDLSSVAEVVTTPGPYATAYLDVTRAHENAAHEIGLRWRELRASLADQGADEDTLRALDEAVTDETPAAGVAGRCLVAGHGRIHLDRPLPGRPRRAEARWATLPHLFPYLAQLPRALPYVVAVVDRIGADLFAFEPAPTGLLRARDDEVVRGADHPITKVAAGGWSQPRYQQRAENLWEANARKVAAELDRLVDEVGADLLVAAGDPRARAALRDGLSSRAAELLVETEAGGRGLGSSDDALADAVDELVDRRYGAHLSEVLERFGNQGGGRDGLVATLEALRHRRVDTLLVRDDPDSQARLFVGPEPDQVALSAEDLTRVGVARPERERADAALVRAAAAGGAELVILSSDRSEPGTGSRPRPDAPELRLHDGVGFLARY